MNAQILENIRKLKLNLNAYGVSELNHSEVIHINGGGVWKWVYKGLEYLGVIEVATEFMEGFCEGFERGYNEQQNKE